MMVAFAAQWVSNANTDPRKPRVGNVKEPSSGPIIPPALKDVDLQLHVHEASLIGSNSGEEHNDKQR